LRKREAGSSLKLLFKTKIEKEALIISSKTKTALTCWQQINKMGSGIARIASQLLFPASCLGCGVTVSQHGTICPKCWQDLHLISRPFCPIMGNPFSYDAGEDLLSMEALHDPPPFAAARSVALHDGLARQLITRLKYGNHTELAPWMANWMIRISEDFFQKKPLIIPVPLHRLRFWQRGYNQSAELARFIAAETGQDFFPEGLRRKKYTHQQVGLSAKARKANLRGAFHVPDTARQKIHNRPIVLIDDVFTTGATVRAAAKTLCDAGATCVYVLTFSRAPSPS